MKNPLSWSPLSFWLLVAVIIPVLAVLVTFATGYLIISSGIGGFPVPWAGLVFQPCPLLIACTSRGCPICDSSKIIQVNYDWLSFGVDILFYTAIGYSVVLFFSWARPTKSSQQPTNPSVDRPESIVLFWTPLFLWE